MYCIKVQTGSERIRVRNYSNGFLPGYKPVDAYGKTEGRRLVVPGYIFMLQQVPRAERVPDAEWKVIEAVSDPHLSLIDRETEKITFGPLAAVQEQIVRVGKHRVLVRARILGELREYWLPVKDAEEAKPEPAEEEPAPAEDAEAADGKDDGNGKEQPMGEKPKNTFTDEEKERMLARAEEIGVKAAAAEFSVPWQVIAQYKRRKAEKTGAPAAKKPEKAKRRRKKEEPEEAADAETLKRENAKLREKVAKLEAKVAKLQKAIRELM